MPSLFRRGSELKMKEAPDSLKGLSVADSPNVNWSCPSFLKPKVPIFPCFEYIMRYSR